MVKKVSVGFFPTPLQYLSNLSKEFGYNLYVKRDDFTGPNLFGGNKIRKLEYLAYDAIKQGADTLITFGATQSNHAMETAVVARKLGLNVILYLEVINEPDPQNDKGNILLDKIFGAKIHYVSMKGLTEQKADEIALKQAKKEKEKLKKQGHQAYLIPVGGANVVGSTGFAYGYQELKEQMKSQFKQQPDFIFHSSGTGGTAAGLIAGIRAFSENGQEPRLYSINVSPKPDTHAAKIAKLATGVLVHMGSRKVVTATDLHFDFNYFGAGYEVPTPQASATIRKVARTEGFLLDPVYTAKGFTGMLDYLKKGRIPKNSNVVFWHTGGISGLFAEKQIVGKLY